MSWLNNSLNTIKGQLTTLAQEVLAETAGPGDEEYRGTLASLDARTTTDLLVEMQKDKEELDKLCVEKETEILMLRKQIEILQQQQQQPQQQQFTDTAGGTGTASVNSGRNSKSPTDNNGSSPLEDSWCWELDNTKNDNDHSSETSSGGNSHELVNITLDEVSNENPTNIPNTTKAKQIKSRIHRLGNGSGNVNQEQRQQQNGDVQKCLQQLEEENKRLNIALDELDTQHSLAMENMLELKTTLQEQLNVITKNYEIMEKEYQEKLLTTANDITNYKETIKGLLEDNDKFENMKNNYETQFKCIESELKQKQAELNAIQELLNKKSQDNNELLDLIKERDQKNEKLLTKQEELTQKLHDLTQKATIDEMKVQSNDDNKKSSSDSSNSSVGKQSEDEFIVIRDMDSNFCRTTGTPPTKEELKDKIVQLENKVSELTIENEKISLKFDDIVKDNEKTLEFINEKVKHLYSMDNENVEVQKKLTNLKSIIEIITLNENELKLLKEKNQSLNRDFEELKETFNDENSFLTNENERLKLEVQNLHKSQAHFNELEQKLQAISKETQQLKLNAEAEAEISFNNHAELEEKLKILREENDALKTEIERISKLTTFTSTPLNINEENKQTITVTDLDDDEDKIELEQLLNKIKNLIVIVQKTIATEDNLNDFEQINEIILLLKDKFNKIPEMEKSIKDLSDKLLEYENGKLVWEHDKKTLEADISQYILQCDELMKNNEILLNELENYKRHKLETISEHNEESIVLLEGQLDEINKLNSTLNHKIEKLENYNKELMEQLQQLKVENEDHLLKEKDKNLQIDTLELEKCKLLLELNNLQTELNNDKTMRCNDDEKFEQLNAEIKTLTKKYDDNMNILEECIQEKNYLKEEMTAKDIIVESLKQQIKVLQSDKHNAENEILQLQKDLSQTYQQIENMKIIEEQLLQLQNEKDQIEQKLKNVEEELACCNNELKHLQEEQQNMINVPQAQFAQIEEEKKVLIHEKQEMIKVLQQKHSENTQYYSEIQRLQTVINEMEQLQQQQQQQQIELNDKKMCDKCPNLQLIIEELKNEQIKLNDQINFLKEKSNILTTNLLTEQTNQKLMKEENADVLEQNATLRKDLERLRGHLLEIEDMHTKEMIEMQKEMDKIKQKMLILEEEASQSNTAYTSANIRANQHAETLQAQYALVVQQRDDLVVKLSLAEDRESKNQAAIINLQCALEQFQNNKENDIKLVTQRIHRELQQQCDKEIELKNEIQQLQQQLIEANHGLEAAARLSDQLESSQQTVLVLREEVDHLKQQIKELEVKLSSSECNQADKIEKSLIKSLLIGYVVSGNMNDKQQILRMIASILEFNQNETDKIGLNKSSSSWFGSLLGGGISSSSGTGNNGIHSKENLVQAFVQFLEQESQPKNNNESVMPNLLNITGAIDSKGSISKHHNTTNSSTNVQVSQHKTTTPVPLLLNSNIIEDFPMSRNSSSILKDILNDT